MDDITYCILTIDNDNINQVEDLFFKFYKELEKYNLDLHLINDGKKIWRNSIEKSLNKTNFITIACHKNLVIAFCWSFLKILPNYLGNSIIGFIGGIYILPEYRNKSIGKDLYINMEEVLIKRNVRYIELEVMPRNLSASVFWQKMKYKEELIKMSKHINEDNL